MYEGDTGRPLEVDLIGVVVQFGLMYATWDAFKLVMLDRNENNESKV